ncbi:C2H2 finger domain protein [Penicillium angulare]|uniref:C2H2 finger domain protein n=1 Tax=Penicillium angulare TaxID=116970 RepID=UPI00253F71A4|nr:C2H2 finger domain protein [Penicillium angulare]KAJ5257017.1 C2H2 finger domain protein [Penicillium angulare]
MEAERTPNPPQNAGPPERKGPPTIECPYEQCPRLFYTQEALREHKQSEPTHPYCFQCKTDFATRAELFLHKLSSPKHHACPICSLDFRSRGGRDVHIRSNHRPEQEIECTGCGRFFKAASTLIKHIECNDCPEIRISRMLLEQHRREQVHSGLHQLAMEGPMTGSFDPLSKNTVAVPAGAIDQPIPAKEPDDDPPLIEFSSDSEGSPVNTKKTPSTTTGKKQNEKGKGKGRRFEASKKPSSPQPLRIASQNMRHLTLDEILLQALKLDEEGCPVNPDAVFPSEPNELVSYEEATEDPLPSGTQSDGQGNFGVPLMPISELLRDRLPGWESNMFFDANRGEFVCACGWGTVNVAEFEYHVAMEKRWITVTQCPECGKVFSSTAALVAHMEQVRSRCRIRDTKDFARIMGDVTGGLVQIRGELPDGGDRIIVRQLQDAGMIVEPMLQLHGAK